MFDDQIRPTESELLNALITCEHRARSDATVSRVTDDAVECDVYDWVTGRPVTRRFDLRTGQPR